MLSELTACSLSAFTKWKSIQANDSTFSPFRKAQSPPLPEAGSLSSGISFTRMIVTNTDFQQELVRGPELHKTVLVNQKRRSETPCPSCFICHIIPTLPPWIPTDNLIYTKCLETLLNTNDSPVTEETTQTQSHNYTETIPSILQISEIIFKTSLHQEHCKWILDCHWPG